ncbi:gluconate transporter [Calidifontibacter sp. DB0510]|uniref:Gluconate transporter n=1 Tax=Metallococcus carri TaxID=1656884 RepID=A0A967B0Q8_9MICO|nr:gluconate transporter [Metallococcus carri]NOP38960.1 gluconate transporter [Calidifontibacter sp. DB2511S]
MSLLAADPPISQAGSGQLALAALASIAAVVLLITVLKLHPFVSLLLGCAVLALVAWVPGADAIDSVIKGVGNTAGSVGLLIALGAMLGQMLAESGAADRVVGAVTDRLPRRMLPWGIALVAAVIGLPMFFEIGVVILVPIVILIARRTRMPLLLIGIPALAGLSILHGLVPPHPGPQTAIAALKADQGLTLIYGLIVAVPTLIVAGPLLAIVLNKMMPLPAGAAGAPSVPGEQGSEPGLAAPAKHRQPGVGAAIFVVLVPVLLMLPAAIVNLWVSDGIVKSILDVLGTPVVALLIAVIVAYLLLGVGTGMGTRGASDSLARGLPGVAGIILIVAAGGGFKQLLVDAGVGKVIADAASSAHLPVLLLGWLVAVGIRLATGSATVATITAAGIVSGLAGGLTPSNVALLVLAIGCGSLFFSHVNDAGFWLVKEYFGLTVGQTLKSWSVMETVISVVGFLLVLALSVVV